MINRLLVMFLLVISIGAVLAVPSGCALDVTHGDLNSITHLEDSRDRYIGDIYYAAVPLGEQGATPIVLDEEWFPIGTLGYEDYTLTLEGYQTHIDYELEKIKGDDERATD